MCKPDRGSGTGVHAHLRVHLPIWRGRLHFSLAIEGTKYVYILLISNYLYIYQWILFSRIIMCLLVNIVLLFPQPFCHKKFERKAYMLIYRNAEGVHGQRKFGNPVLRSLFHRHIFSLQLCTVSAKPHSSFVALNNNHTNDCTRVTPLNCNITHEISPT